MNRILINWQYTYIGRQKGAHPTKFTLPFETKFLLNFCDNYAVAYKEPEVEKSTSNMLKKLLETFVGTWKAPHGMYDPPFVK